VRKWAGFTWIRGVKIPHALPGIEKNASPCGNPTTEASAVALS